MEMLQRGAIGSGANLVIIAMTTIAAPLSLAGFALSWGSILLLIGALLSWVSWDYVVLSLLLGMILLSVCHLGSDLEMRVAWRSAARKLSASDFAMLSKIAQQEDLFLSDWVRRRAAA